MSEVLAGVRVLDFGRYIAGPFCATMLADFGAEVIRIEKVAGSEDRYISSVCQSGEGGTFLQMGRNKKCLTLNPMKPEGRQVVERLLKTADIVIANLPIQTLRAMGIDYDSLVKIKPDIILVHISAFGGKGPYSQRVGFDLVGQAMSGMMHISGEPQKPVRSHTPYVDYSTALFAAFGAMAALFERHKSGQGQLVEASLFSSSLALNNNFLIEEGVLENNRQPHGATGHHHAPNDIFSTKDGHIVTMVVGNPLFARWAKLMGEEDKWLNDPRFASDALRGAHGAEISARMAAWCKIRSTEEAMSALEAAQVPAGPVLSAKNVLQDAHVMAQKLFQPTQYPGLKRPAPLVDTPVRLSRTPGGIRTRPPVLGEHTQALLAELGYCQEDIEALRKARVV